MTPHMSIAQVAEVLGCDERTVRNYIARGDLAASRIKGSRLIRINSADVAALLEPIPTVGGAA